MKKKKINILITFLVVIKLFDDEWENASKFGSLMSFILALNSWSRSHLFCEFNSKFRWENNSLIFNLIIINIKCIILNLHNFKKIYNYWIIYPCVL